MLDDVTPVCYYWLKPLLAQASDDIREADMTGWPIDVAQLTLLYGNHEPVLDFTTKQPVHDKDTGFPVFRVNLMRLDATGGRPEVLAVKVAGEPQGLKPAEPVRCEGLTVQFWEVDRKSGIAFRAEAIVSASAARAKAVA